MKEIFTRIYRDQTWLSTCGSGSTTEYTAQLIPKLQDVIDRYLVKILLDAPSGLYRWIGDVKVETYIGADIVPGIVLENQMIKENSYWRGRVDFIELDITTDPLPKADLWLCRACLFHLSEQHILKTVENFRRSAIPLALFTTHDEHDGDIPDGGFRRVNMERFMGPPLEKFDDGPLLKMGLWSR